MSQFSHNMLVDLVDALSSDLESYDDIELFLIRFGIEEADKNKLGIVKYLIDHPDKAGPLGDNVVVEIIEYLIETRCDLRDPFEEKFPRLMRALKHNGYAIEDGKIIRGSE